MLNSEALGTLSLLGDGIPPTLIFPIWLAAFASLGCACVPTARIARTASEVVALDVLAAGASLGNTDVAAANVVLSAKEIVAMPVRASLRAWRARDRACTIGVLGDWIPFSLRLTLRLAALAALGCACVSTARIARTASEVVALDVLATMASLGNADVAAANV